MATDPFRRAHDEYLKLRAQLERKAITAAAFETALHELMFEHDGRFWMLGVNSGGWYVHDGQDWVSAEPPEIQAATVALPLAPAAPLQVQAKADYATVPLPVAPVPSTQDANVDASIVGVAEAPSSNAPMPPVPVLAGLPRAYKLAFALQIVSGLLVFALGVALSWVVFDKGNARPAGDTLDIDLATSPLVLGIFMILLGFSALSRRWLLALAIPAIVAGIGFACAHYNLSSGHRFWWWPDLLVAVGTAAFVGALVGAIVRRFAP